MSDIKIAIIGRKVGEYHDDAMLTGILALLERFPDDIKRSIVWKLLEATHRNGMKQAAQEIGQRCENIDRNMGFIDSFDYQTFLADAPTEPTDTSEIDIDSE